MRHSFPQILAKAGFCTIVLASAQAASALTFTYSTTSATYVPNPNSLLNTRPIQLSPTGGPMTTGSLDNRRNFIYTSLVGSDLSTGNWIPVVQSTTAANSQRFDYYFPNASSSGTFPGGSGTATVHNWNNNLNLDFGSFYLDGSCSFCGSANAVSIISATNTGTAQFIGEADTSTVGNSNGGSQNEITSSIYNIMFGTSGITGTLQYTASTNVVANPLSQSNKGTITIMTNGVKPPNGVPGPLPILGAGVAYGYSRRLRQRILGKANRMQNI